MELNNKEAIWRFADRLRTVVPFYGFSSTAIQLIFLKYMANFTDITDINDFKTVVEYKDMFIKKSFNHGLTKDVYEIAERRFEIEKGLLSSSLDSLFDTFKDNEEYIFEVMNEIDLPKDTDSMKELLELLLDFSENKDITRTAVSTTNGSLLELVSKILAVKDDEIYLDCFSGFFRSSLEIKANNYLGYELNHEVASIANMIMILSGKKIFSVKNQDFYLQDLHGVANKVFADGPLGMNVSEECSYKLGFDSKKSEYYNLRCAVEALKENGMACVTTPQGVLFRTDFTKLRELLTYKNLKAVIVLPSMWAFTSINTCLLVLEENCVSKSVMMIDASDAKNLVKGDKKSKTLSAETIEKILVSLNGTSIEDFSEEVSREDILHNESVSWIPPHYIKKEIKRDYRPVSVIDKELTETYEEVIKLLKK